MNTQAALKQVTTVVITAALVSPIPQFARRRLGGMHIPSLGRSMCVRLGSACVRSLMVAC